MPRPTIHDVAAAAKVSLATVDRVLNDRGGVAAKSVEKVLNAVDKTGYVRDQTAANLSRKRAEKFTFVLPGAPTAFLERLRFSLQQEAERLQADRIDFEERTSNSFDTDATATTLQHLMHNPYGCVAVMAPDGPAVRAEVTRLTEAGVKVITLVSDLPGSERRAFVGIDNLAAGRAAARFMGRFMKQDQGLVKVIVGSMAARDHMERLMGFQQIMRDYYPQIEVLPVVEGYDEPDRINEITRRALTDPLTGIYHTGAGNRGLADALRAHDGPRPTVIVHELTPQTRNGLHDDLFDLVIDQDPARAARRAITLMRDLSAGRPVAVTDGDIPLNIFIKENTP
ncbi:LacI family DNA-binding transcriptional regulator [Yoonia sp. R2331]|uniref:LacI family DNA-binding transcriptional regulator n=1 Tax=Yoonia sp. R2331 TaxID=3237238 RepID=UPI0034E4910D